MKNRTLWESEAVDLLMRIKDRGGNAQRQLDPETVKIIARLAEDKAPFVSEDIVTRAVDFVTLNSAALDILDPSVKTIENFSTGEKLDATTIVTDDGRALIVFCGWERGMMHPLEWRVGTSTAECWYTTRADRLRRGWSWTDEHICKTPEQVREHVDRVFDRDEQIEIADDAADFARGDI